jgi:hypothetical protein
MAFQVRGSPDIDAIIVDGELPESLLSELLDWVLNQMYAFYMSGWSLSLRVWQIQPMGLSNQR